MNRRRCRVPRKQNESWLGRVPKELNESQLWFEVTYMTERKIKYQCPICNLPYMHKGGVERHIKLNHSLPDGNPKKIITSRMGI